MADAPLLRAEFTGEQRGIRTAPASANPVRSFVRTLPGGGSVASCSSSVRATPAAVPLVAGAQEAYIARLGANAASVPSVPSRAVVVPRPLCVLPQLGRQSPAVTASTAAQVQTQTEHEGQCTENEEWEDATHPLEGLWVDQAHNWYDGSIIEIYGDGWWRPLKSKQKVHQRARYTSKAISEREWDLIETRDDGEERRFKLTALTNGDDTTQSLQVQFMKADGTINEDLTWHLIPKVAKPDHTGSQGSKGSKVPCVSGMSGSDISNPQLMRNGHVRLLCGELEVRYKQARRGLIMVFPLGQKVRRKRSCWEKFTQQEESDREWVVSSSSGGSSLTGPGRRARLHDDVHNPIDMAKLLFKGRLAGFADLDELREGIVNRRTYLNAVREHFLHVMRQAGFCVDTSLSIDKDEVFLNIKMDHEGLCNLAEKYRYKMPLAEEAAKALVSDQVWERMRSKVDGTIVLGHMTYSQRNSEYFADFRPVDEVRLIMKHLNQFFNLKALLDQHIFSRYFPAANYADVSALNEVWLLPQVFTAHDLDDDKTSQMALEKVRDYFGESVAFFFLWLTFYIHKTKYLAAVAAFGIFIYHVDHYIHHNYYISSNIWSGSLRPKRLLQFGFAIIMIAWGSLFNKLFSRQALRYSQKWGMKESTLDRDCVDRDDYNEDMEDGIGREKVECYRWLTKIYMFLFCFAFVFFIGASEGVILTLIPQLQDYQAYLLSVTIFFWNGVWGKLAYILVKRENHRNEHRFMRSLAWTLSVGKLFVSLWPFLYTAFVMDFVNVSCEPTFGEAAFAVYSKVLHQGIWPESIPMSTNVTEADLPALKGYYYITQSGHYTGAHFIKERLHDLLDSTPKEYCIWGCFPIDCSQQDYDKVCRINCITKLQTDLNTFFVLDVAFRICFHLLIPIVIVTLKVENEARKVQRQRKSSGQDYTYLEFQAKCHKVASYQYGSWGGSHPQDFLQLVIGYTLMVCFIQVAPLMAIIGLFGLVADYKLLAFRMTNITCRPKPERSQGIGVWQDILTQISFLAVTINVALAVFVMTPLEGFGSRGRLLIFIVAEKALLLLRCSLSWMESQPDDVRRIEDQNAILKNTLVAKAQNLENRASKEFAAVSIAVGEEPSDSSGSDSGGELSDEELLAQGARWAFRRASDRRLL